MALEVVRDGKPVRLIVPKNDRGIIGVSPAPRPLPFSEAVPSALKLPAAVMWVTLKTAKEMVTGEEVARVGSADAVIAATPARERSSLLAMLLSHNLLLLYFYYALVLLLDYRARARYQARVAAAPTR